jgi:CDP-2,3-bis-(O-geranylgeranyl)-sn-glycerol synthase
MRAAIDAFLLLITANSVPWVLGKVLGRRGDWPLDFGGCAWDGERILGSHKTWRGLLSGALACGGVSAILGHDFALGLEFGALSLLGDALSSAIKRRFRYEPGRQIPALDQLPETLLPLVVLASALELTALAIIVVAGLFTCVDVLVRRLSHHD